MEMIGKGGRAIGRSSDGDSEKGPSEHWEKVG